MHKLASSIVTGACRFEVEKHPLLPVEENRGAAVPHLRTYTVARHIVGVQPGLTKAQRQNIKYPTKSSSAKQHRGSSTVELLHSLQGNTTEIMKRGVQYSTIL